MAAICRCLRLFPAGVWGLQCGGQAPIITINAREELVTLGTECLTLRFGDNP
jgi:hypothetical protein